MNERITLCAMQSYKSGPIGRDGWPEYSTLDEQKFAELIIKECVEQVEQAKNSSFVSLDDAKRMAHFVDGTTKKIKKHFGVE